MPSPRIFDRGFAPAGSREKIKESRDKHFPSNSKPDVVVPELGLDVDTIRGAQEGRNVVPRPASQHLHILLLVVPTGGPLPDVSCHVLYALWRGTARIQAHRCRLLRAAFSVIVRPCGVGFFVPPRVLAALLASGRPLPLAFAQQPPSGPSCVR